MNEFNFRVANAAPRASIPNGTLPLSSEMAPTLRASVKTIQASPSGESGLIIQIQSYKEKLINGKKTGSSAVDFDYTGVQLTSSDWIHDNYTKPITIDGKPGLEISLRIDSNSESNARSWDMEYTQKDSGKKVTVTITQEPNFTYTYFLGVLNVSSTVGANIGATTTIRVQSYMTRSDGEKMAKQPSVEATPSFATKVTVKDGSVMAGAPHWYQIIVEATAANISSAERSGTLLVTCGDQRKEVTIWQQAAEQDIILTIHWPLNTNSAAFFKEGQTPQSGSTGTAYFNFSVLDDTSVHKYKKSEGIRVNLRDGNTEIAYPGDRISAYRFTNQAWQLRSTFILPSSDQSITL